MNKKIATIILVVMFAVLAALVIASTVTDRSVGAIKAKFSETR